jgi:hypothetical protein
METVKIKKTPFCSKVLTINQLGPTCWFLATFMAMFYSQRSRKLLIEAAKQWDQRIEIFRILKHILLYKYMKTDNVGEDYKYFDIIKAESILTFLNKHNKGLFEFDPTKKEGYFTESYVSKLYKFLNVDSLMLERVNTDKVAYAVFNHYTNSNLSNVKIDIKYGSFIKKQLAIYKTPSVLILIVNDTTNPDSMAYERFYNSMQDYYLTDKKNIENLCSLNDKIYYNGQEYNLDSVILSNWNKDTYHLKNIGHAICGITCKNERYVYNGWTRYTLDPNITKGVDRAGQNKYLDLPCELMKLNWSIRSSHDFCLNTNKCIPDNTNISTIRDLCFSFNKGKRILIYVKKNMASQTSNDDDNDTEYDKPAKSIINDPPNKPLDIPNTIYEKKCPDGKILNPFTKRCIKIKGSLARKKHLVNPKKFIPKICPPGKTLNPLTNRCVKNSNLKKIANKKIYVNPDDPNKKPKICPPGKYLNTITNRCNKIKKLNKKIYIDKPPLIPLEPDDIRPTKKNTNVIKRPENNVPPHSFIPIVPPKIEPVPPSQKRIGEPHPKTRKSRFAYDDVPSPSRKLSPVSPINPKKKLSPSQYLNTGPFIPKTKIRPLNNI